MNFQGNQRAARVKAFHSLVHSEAVVASRCLRIFVAEEFLAVSVLTSCSLNAMNTTTMKTSFLFLNGPFIVRTVKLYVVLLCIYFIELF